MSDVLPMTETELKGLNRGELVRYAKLLELDTGPSAALEPGYLNMGAIRALVLAELAELAESNTSGELELVTSGGSTMASHLGKSVIVHGHDGTKRAGRVIGEPRANHHKPGARNREDADTIPGSEEAWCVRIDAVGRGGTADIWCWFAKDAAAAKATKLLNGYKTHFTVV